MFKGKERRGIDIGKWGGKEMEKNGGIRIRRVDKKKFE